VLDDPSAFFKGHGKLYEIHTDSYFSGGMPLEEEDMALYVGFSGPGYGDVLERDPKLVEQDLKDRSISTWAAENVYKVEFDPDTLDVDVAGTKKNRVAERKARLARGKTWDAFQEEWSAKKPPENIMKNFGPWPFPEEQKEIIEM
jgi:acetophenone carboxylase